MRQLYYVIELYTYLIYKFNRLYLYIEDYNEMSVRLIANTRGYS